MKFEISKLSPDKVFVNTDRYLSDGVSTYSAEMNINSNNKNLEVIPGIMFPGTIRRIILCEETFNIISNLKVGEKYTYYK